MNPYPFDSILLNGRDVSIASIRSQTFKPLTTFERSTIEFIDQWLEGTESFTQKTSGSTGAPKEIEIKREHMIRSALATAEALELNEGARAFICLDTRYIAGKMMIVRSFVTGMRMIFHEPTTNPFKEKEKWGEVDFIALVPLQVEEILASNNRNIFNHLNTVIIGGAPLREEARSALNGFSARIYLTYGMTETTSHVALQRINSTEQAFHTLPGIGIEADERGCLILSVPWLPEKIATNDSVQIISSRSFKWIGRVDNVINSGGIKVHPEKIEFQIEKILASLNVNRRVFIAGLPDKLLGEKVVLFVEGAQDDALGARLNLALKTILQRFEMPKSIEFIEKFSYTATGKVDRKQTLQVYRTDKT
jgi:o-succinylbenzoate---CoA ligase